MSGMPERERYAKSVRCGRSPSRNKKPMQEQMQSTIDTNARRGVIELRGRGEWVGCGTLKEDERGMLSSSRKICVFMLLQSKCIDSRH